VNDQQEKTENSQTEGGDPSRPEAFWPHLRPDGIEPENGPEVIEVKESGGYARPRAQGCREVKRGLNSGKRDGGFPGNAFPTAFSVGEEHRKRPAPRHEQISNLRTRRIGRLEGEV
jgi:hypothetical protein